MKGLFIVFEGIDGAGTTTQTRLLAKRLEALGRRVLTTAEPSNGPVGSLVRQVLKGRIVGAPSSTSPFDRRALALLFAADRIDHVACEIAPSIENGFDVISDRYVLSSLAYQGIDAPREWVATINRFAPIPDITFFLKLSPQIAWERIRRSRPDRDIFEALEILDRVEASYEEALFAYEAARVEVIDGSLPVDQVSELVWKGVSSLL